MRRYGALLPLLLLVMALAHGCGGGSGDEPLPTLAVAPRSERIEVRIGELVIQAEPARTSEERAQGLSDRPSMPPDEGMLFFLGEERIPGFSMRRMHFPLDFIWISADGVVADVTPNVPPPTEVGDTYEGIRPGVAVLYVLEVNAGTTDEYVIGVGDEVTFTPDITAGP